MAVTDAMQGTSMTFDNTASVVSFEEGEKQTSYALIRNERNKVSQICGARVKVVSV